MRVKFLLVSLSLILAIEGALGCLCLRNGDGCNCLPRARLRLNRLGGPRNIVAVIQPLPQDQLINPNVCRCGRRLLPAFNPLNPLTPLNPLPDTPDLVPDYDQTAFGARCTCTRQQQLDDCDQFAADPLPRFLPSSLTPEVLPPAALPPGTPYWTVNEQGVLELVQPNDPLQNLPNYLEDPAELLEDKIEGGENFLQYLNQLLQSGAEQFLTPLFNNP